MLTGHFDTKRISKLIVSSIYVYLAIYNNGLQIIDISEPSLPKEASIIATGGGYIEQVFVSGSYAYLADKSYGMRIVDISNPSFPKEIGSLKTNGSATKVVVQGIYAYIRVARGILIVDISDPSIPKEINFVEIGLTVDIVVRGNYIFATTVSSITTSSTLHILDISNPLLPEQVSYLDVGGRIEINGSYLYLVDYYNGLKIIDISNIVEPVEVGNFKNGGMFTHIAVNDDYAYLAMSTDYSSHMVIVNISNRTSPYEVSRFAVRDFVWGLVVFAHSGIAVGGSYVYLPVEISNMYVIDVSNPSEPKEVNSFETEGSRRDVAVDESYVYIADGGNGLYILQDKLLVGNNEKTNPIPQKFNLEQNYPNPFNPSTEIRYDLPQGGAGIRDTRYVTLKVYDILGREVATLVNKEQSAGSYEVNFNASGLSSGIFFYKLETKNFNKSMKMILLK